jgi:hypothetical protein
MSKLAWSTAGQRRYETGVDHGVLYIPNDAGAYLTGYAWNGLTTVTETPGGAEANPQYADNTKYLNLLSAEDLKLTVEALTYPAEFEQCDGIYSPESGVGVGQQSRKAFGLSYRTNVGNDVAGSDYGYKLHLVYGCLASPSERGYSTINDSPEAINFSWDVSTTPVPVTGKKPTSIITIDSTNVDGTALATLEDFLYGTVGTDPSLPLPDAVLAIFAGTVVEVTPGIPTYVNETHTLTVPSTSHVSYINAATGATLTSGDHTVTADMVVQALPAAGYKFPAIIVDRWFIDYS